MIIYLGVYFFLATFFPLYEIITDIVLEGHFKSDGQNVWIWDIIDDKSRYLLATCMSRNRTTRDAQMLYDRAVNTAGKEPEKVITDKLASYLDVRYGKDTEHIQGKPFAVEDNTQMIEHFHEMLKQRTRESYNDLITF